MSAGVHSEEEADEAGEVYGPNATTLFSFCHLLEREDLTTTIFREIGDHLEERGSSLQGDATVDVDATFIAAPSAPKNRDSKCDPEMHQARKGNER